MYSLDTHAAIRALETAGIERKHAEAIVSTIARADEQDRHQGRPRRGQGRPRRVAVRSPMDVRLPGRAHPRHRGPIVRHRLMTFTAGNAMSIGP